MSAELASIKAAIAQRRAARDREDKYSPNQPRVPAGNGRESGRWTDGSYGAGARPRVIIDTTNLDTDSDGDDAGGDGSGASASISAFDIGDISSESGSLGLFDIKPRENRLQGVQLAGDPPDRLPPIVVTQERPPEIPPPERGIAERSIDFIRRAAEYVRIVGRLSHAAGALFEALEQAEGLRGETAAIKSANDPPRTLEELQTRARLPSEPGYQTHHIVGQFEQNRLQFGDGLIYSRENEVRIPVVKHMDISRFYSTPNAQFGGLSPRDYLRGKSWDEQMQVGLNVLKRFGVLQ
ncbi:MAG: hypothetical protein JSS22_02230 [Proteobacteria bacterium]|nr:hypothetical protein [Pseudomonadota bacterium]